MEAARRCPKSDYMSDAYSGPLNAEDRHKWLKKIKADRDRSNRMTTCYDVNGAGTPISEAGDVAWRVPEVSSLIEARLDR